MNISNGTLDTIPSDLVVLDVCPSDLNETELAKILYDIEVYHYFDYNANRNIILVSKNDVKWSYKLDNAELYYPRNKAQVMSVNKTDLKWDNYSFWV